MTRNDVIKRLGVIAELFGKTLSKEAAMLLVHKLEAFPPSAAVAALDRCLEELPRFPTIADIVQRIDDGRPGPEEAWSMIPRDESCTVVWTEEMRACFGVASSLLREGDQVAARMAFKEAYTKAVAEARRRKEPVRWSVSLGFDKLAREAVLKQAVAAGRIGVSAAQSLCPELVLPRSGAPRLAPPAEKGDAFRPDFKAFLRGLPGPRRES